MPRVILLDFDGVLAETDNVHVAAWEQVFDRIGLDVPLDLCERAPLVEDEALFVEVLARLKLRDADASGWVRRKREIAGELFAREVRMDPDAAALVRLLAGRSRLAAVSTARGDDVRAVLSRAGLADAFEVVAAGAEMMAGVSTYQHALKELQEVAADALAVVSTDIGHASATASGLRVLRVGRGEPGRVDVRDAGAVVDAIEALG